MLNLIWIKCDDGRQWCPLESVNLSSVTAKGVYIIWHGGNATRVIRIGQGDIADRLAAHRNDPEILEYAKSGTLLVTWAAVLAAQRDGVERYLGGQWPPLVGDAFPDVQSIAVNSPW
jgi:hypothetical protein